MEFAPGSETERRLLAQLEREMGPTILGALEQPDTEELALNEDGRLWHKRLGQGFVHVGDMKPLMAAAFLRTMSSFLDEPIDPSFPLVNGELPPHGYRLSGTLAPVTRAPTFTIRVPTIERYLLEDYVEQGTLSPHQRDVLREAVVRHQSILVVGGTGSGKTTLTNTLTGEIVEAFPDERLVIVEDTREIVCEAANHVQLRTKRRANMTALVRQALRMRPNRIIVGEVRGGEALDLLRAWGTGHPGGLSTMHANSAAEALVQLETLVSMHPDAPADARIPSVVGLNVDVVVSIAEGRKGRKVQEVIEVLGYSASTQSYETRTL